MYIKKREAPVIKAASLEGGSLLHCCSSSAVAAQSAARGASEIMRATERVQH